MLKGEKVKEFFNLEALFFSELLFDVHVWYYMGQPGGSGLKVTRKWLVGQLDCSFEEVGHKG